MKKYKVWVSIYQGNGQREYVEEIIDLEDNLSEDKIRKECEDIIWELLNNESVESGWEEI